MAAKIGSYPLIIRPAFTCGGTGGGIAYNVDEFKRIVAEGIDASMTNQVGAVAWVGVGMSMGVGGGRGGQCVCVGGGWEVELGGSALWTLVPHEMLRV